ncbi:MAG: phosphoribosylanthranilate isomerase [Proteobacteria bacterium]|nr:phosphoribosylanthranilate isomerase [Pseudomonadota bacterium]
MSLLVKICGLTTPESVACAIEAGADMLGLNFYPKSPRYVTPGQAAELAAIARRRANVVALVVDPDDTRLEEISAAVAPDSWQLHGRENAARLAAVKRLFALPVIKALGVSETADLGEAVAFRDIADSILLDAKPPKDAAYPGGHGKVFDWSILSALPHDMPFMLSGGLTPENVGAAIRTLRGMGLSLTGVDVSSGVESAPGVKDLAKIRAFVAAAREA